MGRALKQDHFESLVEQAIADADGDVRRASKAALTANSYLEAELSALYAGIEHGAVKEKSASPVKIFQ